LFNGSACHWKVWGTAFAVLLLNTDATKSSGRELKPALAVAVPREGRFSLPTTLIAVVLVCVVCDGSHERFDQRERAAMEVKISLSDERSRWTSRPWPAAQEAC
jgi:hypothetical protein